MAMERREAAMILSDFLAFALRDKPANETLFTHERDAMVWIENQMKSDASTQINHWTGSRMRALGFLQQ